MISVFAGFLATIAVIWLFALPGIAVWVWCRVVKPHGVRSYPRHHATRGGKRVRTMQDA